jgi:hypothetical protein
MATNMPYFDLEPNPRKIHVRSEGVLHTTLGVGVEGEGQVLPTNRQPPKKS